MRVFLAAFAFIVGITLIATRKKFGQKAVNQRNFFGRANAAAGEGVARSGPLIIGCFMILLGVLVATGLADPK
ncbi:hypothetical protein ABZ916_23500 [Streptomyces sp. NPDC046853]|uniref:hypothetical protein n=1 Tax=Streptomyces sp. NPDC046853 TaxID=3154920 RepID=UPI0033E26C3C